MILRVLFAVFIMAIMFASPVYAQGGGDPIITIESLIGALTPLIIFIVTWLVQKIKPTLVGWNIVWVIIPVLSLLATLVLQLAELSTSFFGQFIWNFLSVAVAQLVLQLTEDKRKANQLQKQKIKNGF